MSVTHNFSRSCALSLWLFSVVLVGCGGSTETPQKANLTAVSADLEFVLDGQTVNLPTIISCTNGVYGAGIRAQKKKGKDVSQDVLRWTGSPPEEDGLKAVITYAVSNGSYMASDDVQQDGEWFSWSGEFTFLEKTDQGTRKSGTAKGSVKFKCNP